MLSLLLLVAPLVAAHGHVESVLVGSQKYQGWNAAFKYQSPIPATVGWQADNLDNGFVSPDAFGTSAIICHKSGKSNGASVPVNPGDTATLVWDTWPNTHLGPIQEYMADCGASCDTVDPASLRWTKIASASWKSGNNPGDWATNDLIKNKFSWNVKIPNVAPGNYVIRHEILALHAAGSLNGAQAYPQCINFKVSGSGTRKLSGGVAGTSLYKVSLSSLPMTNSKVLY